MTALQRHMARRSYRSAEGRRHPDAYTADELHRFLVDDAKKMHATDLAWAVAAYERISSQRRVTADTAFQAVRADVLADGGHMPIASFT